jgi:hypothetical protein
MYRLNELGAYTGEMPAGIHALAQLLDHCKTPEPKPCQSPSKDVHTSAEAGNQNFDGHLADKYLLKSSVTSIVPLH